ncbi:protein MAIN-LIKE 1-like [Vigna angularis]|nr:protein MAIN-LIKE 1-like [Vigna angularis]
MVRTRASARRRHAAPIQDDPIAEDRAFEEEAYQAYEGPVHEEAFEAPHDDNEEEEHVNVPDIQEEDVDGFPGGPRDASLLTHYVQHVAYGISQGRDQGEILKLISHGEMSITLDNVSSLLHLPVLGQLCDLEELEFEEARVILVELLGVDGGAAGAEMEDARGPKVRLSWLRHIYVQRCQSQQDVHACGRYAWGVVALAHLYDQLEDASLASTKHMAGFLTLFQNWIYEHFPTMGRRRLVSSYDETTPRAARWQSPRQSSTLAEIRSQLDGLTYSGVVWHPYEGRRGICPFFGICMYSGWIRIGDILSRYLPERVI